MMRFVPGLSGALILSLALLLAGCGFEPMYAKRSGGASAVAELASVELAPILDAEGRPYRLGLQMQNAMSDALYASGIGAPRYRLEIVIDRELQGFGFRPDEAVTRYGLRLSAVYRLVELATDKVVLTETARAFNSFDVVQSDFATLTAERDMEQRLTHDLSDRISSRLGLYFRDREEGGKMADQPDEGS